MKMKSFIVTITTLLLLQTTTFATEKSPVDYVDPQIGTAHSRWFFYTPAAVPFSMAKPAPSTYGHIGSPSGWEASGYDYRHTSIEGFGNFHEFQIGGVVLAPTVGNVQTTPGELENPDNGYRSRFDKKDEYARPGYYSVLLKDYNVKAELTSTKRVSFHRYTFPESTLSNIIFDIGNRQGESGEVTDAMISYMNDGRIEGWVETTPIYVNVYQKGAKVYMYFSGDISKRPSSTGAFIGATKTPGLTKVQGKGCGMYMTFDTKENEPIEIKLGLSYTSIENARKNMDAEAPKMNFDTALKAAEKSWDEYLGRVKVEGSNEADKTKFYTGLFHALLGRGLASDVNGAYPMNNGEIGQIESDKNGNPIHHHYNTDAIWGGFWNLTQLWSIAYPEYFSDWIQSQLLVYKDAGWLGDGIACSKYVSGVGTNFTGLAIAAAYNCGIRDFDIDLGYQAALKNELGWQQRIAGAGKLDIQPFVEKGYVPTDITLDPSSSSLGSRQGASHTLEYAFGSYAVAQFAKQLGKTDDFQRLTELSKGWKLLYDKETMMIRPRERNGDFLKDFNPYAPWTGFQEGNAVQYTFYVPHHIEELIQTMGVQTFNNRLDSIFTISQKNIFGGGTKVDAFAGLESVYNHGNQPCLHIPWLFNFSGKPYLTQKWVRAICDEFYGTEGIHGYGYGQDEDQGQLGAWYVMAGIGLFDVKGLTSENPSFQIGSPLFDKITIKLNPKYYKGNEFVIETRNNSKTNVYVKSATLNGVHSDNVQLPFESVVKGGKLVLEMGNTPRK